MVRSLLNKARAHCDLHRDPLDGKDTPSEGGVVL